jgi:dTDP-4-amino-4,6-dideoxygalactose transaminase
MIRLGHPQFTAADRERIDDILTTGMLVQGKYVAAFEERVSTWLGTPTLACSNGTAALHLALLACGIGPGDEVLVPAFTWPSTAHVIVQAGARPVFVDIEPDRLGMDPDAARAAVTPATRAIMPVHLFGIPCRIEPLMELAAEIGAFIIEDAACALGTTLDGGQLAGTVGAVGCFSLHPRKIITTGEGGLTATNDPTRFARLNALRNHGMHRTDDGIEFIEAGLNYRLPEIGGALGVGQMEVIDEIVASRRSLAAIYTSLLQDLPVRIPQGVRLAGAVPQSYVVDLAGAFPNHPEPALARKRIMGLLYEAGIESTIGTYAVTDQPVYRAEPFNVVPEDYPVARRAARTLLTLPLHPGLNPDDVAQVVRVLQSSIESTQHESAS